MHLAGWQWVVGWTEFFAVFLPVWMAIGAWERARMKASIDSAAVWVADHGWKCQLCQKRFDAGYGAADKPLCPACHDRRKRAEQIERSKPRRGVQIPPVRRHCLNCGKNWTHHGPQNIDPQGWCPGCVELRQKLRQKPREEPLHMSAAMRDALYLHLQLYPDDRDRLRQRWGPVIDCLRPPVPAFDTGQPMPTDLGELCDEYGTLMLPRWASKAFEPPAGVLPLPQGPIINDFGGPSNILRST